jgi:GT2 family glycosyltransferase
VKSPPISTIIVTYNSERTIDAALSALMHAHDRGMTEVIVVDNDSKDSTRDIVRRHRFARLIPTGHNLGFGRACNVGAAASTSRDCMLFLNPDARIEPAALEALHADLMASPGTGIIAPSIVEADGSLQHAGGLPSPLNIWLALVPMIGPVAARRLQRRNPNAPRDILPDEPNFTTDWVCGAALMIRRELFFALNGFDRRFFLYFEETDLCRRASASGFRIVACGRATATHVAGESASQGSAATISGCIANHYLNSRFYYLKKHHGHAAALSSAAAELTLLLSRAILSKSARHSIRPWLSLSSFRSPAAPSAIDLELFPSGTGAAPAGDCPMPEPPRI